jgi:acyl carrier protein
VTSDTVRSFILSHLADVFAARRVAPEEVSDEFDLLTEGIIDSLGMLELLGAIESHFGAEVDLEDLDPEEMTKIGPFSQYIVAHARAADQ